MTEHQRDKHNKSKKRNIQKNTTKTTNKKNKNSPLVSSPGSSSAWNSLETIISSTIGSFDETNTAVTNITDANSSQIMTPIKPPINTIIPKPPPIQVEKADGEFKCTFNECGFATNTKERLEFHIRCLS